MESNLIKAIAVTAELMGTEFSPEAAQMFAKDLADYPEPSVIEALTKCRQECKGRLSLADVISRINDGRPGPEEAWNLLPQDEAQSVFWTDEMAEAHYLVNQIENRIEARMAFLEKYKSLVNQARQNKKAGHWYLSEGWDKSTTKTAIEKAFTLGYIKQEIADKYLKYLPDYTVTDSRIRSLTESKRSH